MTSENLIFKFSPMREIRRNAYQGSKFITAEVSRIKIYILNFCSFRTLYFVFAALRHKLQKFFARSQYF